MSIMDVDAAANERHTNSVDGVKKIDLSARLQPNQYEMDWEQLHWARSVNASGQQLKITVKFT